MLLRNERSDGKVVISLFIGEYNQSLGAAQIGYLDNGAVRAHVTHSPTM